MTVLEAFAKAFGPFSREVCACFVAWDAGEFGIIDGPVVLLYHQEFVRSVPYKFNDGEWRPCGDWSTGTSVGPNIADRPAESFAGFFGNRYDEFVALGW
jgi:hypothetical protein